MTRWIVFFAALIALTLMPHGGVFGGRLPLPSAKPCVTPDLDCMTSACIKARQDYAKEIAAVRQAARDVGRCEP